MPQITSHGHPEKSTVKIFKIMLQPSLSGAIVCLVIGLGLVGGIIAKTAYDSSPILQIYRQAKHVDQSSVVSSLNGNYSSSKFLTDLPVALFWAFIGLLVYFIVMDLTNALSKAKALHQEMNYINVSRTATMQTVLARAGLRVTALLAWWLYAVFFFKTIVPYCLDLAHIAASDFLSPRGLIYALLAVVMLVVCMHIHIVLLRLTALKPRLIGDTLFLTE